MNSSSEHYDPRFSSNEPIQATIVEVEGVPVGPNLEALESLTPTTSSNQHRPTAPPPEIFVDDDPYDSEQAANMMASFYEDLRGEDTYWVKIKVQFFSSRITPQHLCQRCCDTYLYSFDSFVYYDFVSYHKDCYRHGYFCSICKTKLYMIMD